MRFLWQITRLAVAFIAISLFCSIPPELGNLARLESLRLNSNQLTGSIPVALMNLTALSWLDICYNHLFASDSDLRAFLDIAQPGWESCQTPPFARAIPCIPLLLLGE
jgi:hypothetical protein